MRYRYQLFFLLLTILILSSSRSAFSLNKTATPTSIALRSTSINIEDHTHITALNPNERYFLQFSGPIQQEWLKELEQQHVELGNYIPHYTFRAKIAPEVLNIVAQLPYIKQIIAVQAKHTFDTTDQAYSNDELQFYALNWSSGINKYQKQNLLSEYTVSLINTNRNHSIVLANGSTIKQLANSGSIDWIEPYTLPQTLGNGILDQESGRILKASIAQSRGYDGSSQRIAVTDTGLSTGIAATIHPDLPASRIHAIRDWPALDENLDLGGGITLPCLTAIPNGSQDVSVGHGTHVTLSAVGEGGPLGEGRSTAPGAKLIFQSIEDWMHVEGICTSLFPGDGYYLTALTSYDLFDMFLQASQLGARVHSNSWGGDVNGKYDAQSQSVDEFMWLAKSRTLVFAAGNSGKDSDSNGSIDSDSIGSPATAKNVITIGASENDRQEHYECDTNLLVCDLSGNNNNYSYGYLWDDYSADPIASDMTRGSSEQMAAFSSRGPTDDGRIKPDLVAPGTWILSGYSDMYQVVYDATPNPQDGNWQYPGFEAPYNQYYKYMFGTSMAAPLAAGSAATVRDFYIKHHGLSDGAISAALVKATLINTADDLLDENNDNIYDNALPIPNIHEGWGRINLDRATNGNQQFWQHTGLTTNEVAQFDIVITDSLVLKASLVWTDFPSDPAAAINLVNDLDLEITDPNGTVYYGNNFTNGWSIANGSADRINNVENIYIQNPTNGTWHIRVRGFNIPQSIQPFALVVDSTSLVPTAIEIASFSIQPTQAKLKLQWTTTHLDNSIIGFNVYRNESGPDWATAQRINPTIISAYGTNGSYTWEDSQVAVSQPYWYWIEAITSTTSFTNDAQQSQLYTHMLPTVHR